MSRAVEQMLSEYFWVIVVAMSGGFTSYSQQVWIAKTRPFNGIEFCIELFTAGFSGVIMYLLCESAGVAPLTQAAAVGVAGHMGTRFLYGLHGVVCNYLKCKKQD